MAAIAVDSLIRNLKELMKYQTGPILDYMGNIEQLYKDFGLLRTFLEDWEQEHQRASNLVTRVRDVASKAEDAIDLFVVNNVLKSIALQEKELDMEDSDHPLNLSHVREEMEAIKAEIVDIHNKRISDIVGVKNVNFPNGDSFLPNTTAGEDGIMVGFEDEMMTLKDHLTGAKKQLDVVSIAGMPGLGKTTIARKVYNDPLIKYHFHIHAWVHVSQKYQKREVLLSLCLQVGDDASQPKNDLADLANERSHYASQRSNELLDMTDDRLSEELRKRLKGKRYLLVMDDIWDSRAWEDLRSSLPNDSNGSRIILTSRFTDVVLQAKPSSTPLMLRLLNEVESWDLFQQTVFRGKTCPQELIKMGMQLSKSCKGLPLMIVVVGGILANTEERKDQWQKIEEILNLRVSSSLQLCMETVELSYNHLPNHLKPCFLYFAAFPENYDIPVWKLTWLWVSEGFIQKIGQKSLEEVAEEYLMDLIRRNLILVFGRRSDGGVKTCGMHDLVRSFCCLKAEEENFLQHTSDDEIFSTRFTVKNNSWMRRICISSPLRTHRRISWDTSVTPSGLGTRSFLCFGHVDFSHHQFLSRYFKLLRVLDVSSAYSVFPREVERLVLLRYLALSTVDANFGIHLPTSISNFWNLEILILENFQNVTLPESIWNMSKLRHIRLNGSGIHKIERQKTDPLDSSSLDHLQTLSLVDPWSFSNLLSVAPNLRKLGFRGNVVSWGRLSLPHIHLPIHLEKLKLYNTCDESKFYWSTNFRRIAFPPNLKKLTLRNTNLMWKDMFMLATMLPNLEVIKLFGSACRGFYWKTSKVFPKLKFLLLHEVQIRQWEVSSNHFPVLQQLVLSRCFNLYKIPSEIGDIPTLNMIKVRKCRLAESSAREIKDEQESIGNNWLQVKIN